MTMARVLQVCLLLLVVLQKGTPSLAQTITSAPTTADAPADATADAPADATADAPADATADATADAAADAAAAGYSTIPVNTTVAVGQPAVFYCGVPPETPQLTFTFYRGQSNYNITCPNDHLEDVSQALYGSCLMTKNESLAVWRIKGTSFSDNGTRVVCQQPQNLIKPTAFLHVYDNGVSYYILIGCVIGGFFGVLLVFGLFVITLQRSERFRRAFGGGEAEDDKTEIVTNEEKKI